jgi:hypothetical protein
MHALTGIFSEKNVLTLNLIGLGPEKFFCPFFKCPENFFSTSPPPLANIFGRNSGQKYFFAAGHHRLSQGKSSRHPSN